VGDRVRVRAGRLGHPFYEEGTEFTVTGAVYSGTHWYYRGDPRKYGVWENMLERASVLDGATLTGDPAAQPSTPGEFAARWNERTEEERAGIVTALTGAAERDARCFLENHRPELATLRAEVSDVRLLRARLGVLEAQRRALLVLLAAWDDRSERVRLGRLSRTGWTSIQECRRELSRLIETGPPVVGDPLSVGGWPPCE
jgi:hypothetical protein